MTAAAVEIKVEEAPDRAPGTSVAPQQRSELQTIEDRRSTSITDLLAMAVERGTPVEQLEKLMDLHERMETRQAAKAFADAMAAFQAEAAPVKHNKGADFTAGNSQNVKYGYASLDQIAREINPILAKHGLSYSWDSTVSQSTLTCVCTVRHIAGHSVSSSFTLPTESKSAASPQQKIGMALTFAQRRSLSSVLGLTTTDEDNDASDKEIDPTPITDDQAIVIGDLITESGVDGKKFLAWLEVESVTKIRAADYDRAKAKLEQRRDRREKSQEASP